MNATKKLYLIATWIMVISFSQEMQDFVENPLPMGIPTLLLDSLQLTLSTRLLLDVHSPRGNMLHGYLGWLPLRSNITYTSCSGHDSPSEAICLQYSNNMKLTIWLESDDQCDDEARTCQAVSCYRIQWANHLAGAMDCFVLGDDFWYGGGETRFQRWPMQNDSRSWHAFVTGDPLHHPTGSVIENLWLSSGGFLIYIERNVPLFVSTNDSGSGKLCFSTSFKKHPFSDDGFVQKELTYSICTAQSITEVYRYGSQRWLKNPENTPDELVFQYPIWSTWARYKQNINQNRVLEFAAEINKNNFTNSHIEIDDDWETCYGNLDFNRTKFSNPKQMIRNLNKIGFQTTVWIHPFCNTECLTFQIGEQKGFWVKDIEGKTALVKWWNGIGALLDVTNEDAKEWFVTRLKSLKSQYGIDSFKFDAGEILWLEQKFVLYNQKARTEPNFYSSLYAQMAAQLGNKVEVRVGYNSQHLSVFVRMFDKFSTWGYDNGLKTLIPTALHFSLMGYPFILPDMVGGNNYDSVNGSLPNRELYIRWLQANVFLPVIQFSIAPWEYDKEVCEIALKMVALHYKYSNYIFNVASQSVKTGKPIIRPLWWLAPDDQVALNTDSQFLVGDNILVAPVLEEGMRERDIYLPEGRWTDMLRGGTFEGPEWLYDYEVSLSELPYFFQQL